VNLDDTIVAISTPPGRGGIGVVRLAGPEARAIAAPLLRLSAELEPRRATFGELLEPSTGERLDEVVVTWFEKPHSYTTDEIVEISCHGAPVVLRHAVELAMERGARLADPGEFTLRAFLNNRLDLTQAEAVRDLIESQTLYQVKVAAQQLEGALSHRLHPIKDKLISLIALLEAGIDFAEDDVSVLPSAEILRHIAEVCAPLDALAASFAYGKVVHDGLTLAIIGRPNVGKSSLFNRLVERERAIVTATPGTTRDLVSETVSLGGIPVKLVDTAGLRRALDEAESIGIRKSLEALADADLVLLVLDASQPPHPEDDELLRQTATRPAIVVENKIDLADGRQPKADGTQSLTQRLLKYHPSAERSEAGGPRSPRIFASATTGEGIDLLRAAILRHVGGEAGAQAESGFLTNVRHQGLVRDSLAALDAARRSTEQNVPHEMVLLDLYNALRSLDEITGQTTADDILSRIFSSFCIGK
jgi:tRNA modification GTPase